MVELVSLIYVIGFKKIGDYVCDSLLELYRWVNF